MTAEQHERYTAFLEAVKGIPPRFVASALTALTGGIEWPQRTKIAMAEHYATVGTNNILHDLDLSKLHYGANVHWMEHDRDGGIAHG